MKGNTGHQAISIISASPFPQIFVALGGGHWKVTAAVHYVPSLQRSLPHLEEGCQWCKYPASVKSWFPVQKCPIACARPVMDMNVLALVPKSLPNYSTWLPKICEVPPSAAAILDKIDAGTVFALVRGEGKYHKKVLFRVFEQHLENTLPPFDVRPFLEKSWGMHENPLFSKN